MANFVFSETNVKKNYFRIFVKTAANILAQPLEPTLSTAVYAGVDYAGATPALHPNTSGAIKDLYDCYYEQIGSCKSEPKISSSDVDGLKNNIGTSLGASKEVQVEFTLMDLDGGVTTGDNYLSTIGMDGKAANFIFLDENSGVCYKAVGVVASVNLGATGNSFEELPVIAKKEAASISAVVSRVKLLVGAGSVSVGGVATYEIYNDGDGYTTGSTTLTQLATVPTDAGTSFATSAIVASAGNLTGLTIGTAGTGYKAGDLIVLSGGTASAVLKVLTVA